MNSTKLDARQEFDSWSRRYDRDPLQKFFFGPSHDLLLSAIGNRRLDLLDIGCGTGKFAARVLDLQKESRVFGVDLSDGMLRKAQERAASYPDRLFLAQADSEHLPFADDAFDIITCTHSFHHYPNQRAVVMEMHRVLKPGGKLLIIDGDRDGLWGRLLFDVGVVMVEGNVHHLAGESFLRMYQESGFVDLRQDRQGGPLPFLMTSGMAHKSGRSDSFRRAA